VRGDYLRRAAAEFVGTFALVFIGVVAGAWGGDSGLLTAALAHGLVIAVMASAVGHISGGHFNPAVTLGFVLAGRMDGVLAAVYWATQLLAAVSAALLLAWVLPETLVPVEGGLGVPALTNDVNVAQGIAIEAVLTFFLVWVVFATAADARGAFKSIAGLAIGFTITFDILMGGPLTGAAMNPARAFGPQLVEGVWDDAYVWYLGPLLGGAVAALAYEWLYLRPGRPVPVGPPETGLEEPRPGDAALS
jgi:aquaporin Z